MDRPTRRERIATLPAHMHDAADKRH